MNPFIYSTTSGVSHKTPPGIRPVVDGIQIDLYWIVVHLKAFFPLLLNMSGGGAGIKQIVSRKGVWSG